MFYRAETIKATNWLITIIPSHLLDQVSSVKSNKNVFHFTRKVRKSLEHSGGAFPVKMFESLITASNEQRLLR